MTIGWHARYFVAIGVLLVAGVKLLGVAVSGETAHKDGQQVFCRVEADVFTRVLFGIIGCVLLGVAGFVILFEFGFLF